MKIKEQKIIFIGEDGKPETNADGTFKIVNLYRGFTEKTEYTKLFQDNAKNITKREQKALKELEELKKNEVVNKVIKEANIDDQFSDLIKNIIGDETDIEKIKTNINNLVKEKPKLKKVLNTGGSNSSKSDKVSDDSNTKTEPIKVIG